MYFTFLSHSGATLLVGCLFGLVLAIPNSNHALHERRNVVPMFWKRDGRIHESTVLPVRISMTQTNLDKGHDLLMEVSDPHSPKYGQYYTANEIVDLFAPDQKSVDTIREWLIESGIEEDNILISSNKQWMHFPTTAVTAETILKTEFYQWTHEPSGHKTIACDKYHVPKHVQVHVDYILPGIRLSPLKPKWRNSMNERDSIAEQIEGSNILPQDFDLNTGASLENCTEVITPRCIEAMYNFTGAETRVEGNELGIFEHGSYFNQSNLNQFFHQVYPRIPNNTTPVVRGIDGGTVPPPQGVLASDSEANLDLQVSYPILYPQNITVFQADDYPQATDPGKYPGLFNTFLDGIDGSYCSLNAYGEDGDSGIDPQYPDPSNETGSYKGQLQCGVWKPTNVISLSYGLPEFLFPTNYLQRQCLEYMKLGMRGISVIFSSGDAGVDCPAKGNDVFAPEFPASCPYVTAVGATTLIGNVLKDEEIATTKFGSGGGFSNVFGPSYYQESALQSYFSNHDPGFPYYYTIANADPSTNITESGYYNKGGRGFPDVSAVGQNILISDGNGLTLLGGTSAAAPIFASLLTRINEERIIAGKSPVGFINPVLYKNPSAFHDIVNGSNPIAYCNTTGADQGFSAVHGWDPVTGLGTPNYPALLEVFMALP